MGALRAEVGLGESCAPQLTHARARGAAHSSQNFAPGRLSCRHREHFIPTPLATGGRKQSTQHPGLSSGRTLARASGRVNTDAPMRKPSTPGGAELLFEVGEGPLLLLIAQVRIRAHKAHLALD